MSTGATEQQVVEAAARLWNQIIDTSGVESAKRWEDVPEDQKNQAISEMRNWAELLVPGGSRIVEAGGVDTPVRRARREKGLSAKDAATAIGISLYTLQRMERGQGNPRISTVQTISKLYGKTIEELFPVEEEDEEKESA